MNLHSSRTMMAVFIAVFLGVATVTSAPSYGAIVFTTIELNGNVSGDTESDGVDTIFVEKVYDQFEPIFIEFFMNVTVFSLLVELLLQPVSDVRGPVGRVVVHDDQDQVLDVLAEQSTGQLGEVLGLVVGRDHHGHELAVGLESHRAKESARRCGDLSVRSEIVVEFPGNPCRPCHARRDQDQSRPKSLESHHVPPIEGLPLAVRVAAKPCRRQRNWESFPFMADPGGAILGDGFWMRCRFRARNATRSRDDLALDGSDEQQRLSRPARPQR